MSDMPKPAAPDFARLIPSPAVVQTFLAEVDSTLQANTPDWFPCLKEGCCDGQAGCCQHALNAAIPWTEAEQIWTAIQKMPIEQRRAIAKTAASQVAAAEATDPELFKLLKSDETMAADGLKRLNAVMAAVEEKPCPLLGIPATLETPAKPYACSVYAHRPTICRYFGQCSVTMTEIVDGQPVQDNRLMGCDLTFETFQAKMKELPADTDLLLASGSTISAYAQRLAAPRYGGMQAPLVIKPIPFWIADLTDPTGDITNPDNLFVGIRQMLRQAIEVIASTGPVQ